VLTFSSGRVRRLTWDDGLINSVVARQRRAVLQLDRA
jgi:hypothetical protein